jgi:hypothetical protein
MSGVTVFILAISRNWMLRHLVVPIAYSVTNRDSQSMDPEEMYRYFHWTNSTSCFLAVDFGFCVATGVGIAAPDGHKAVCLDQLIAPIYKNCLVYVDIIHSTHVSLIAKCILLYLS